MDATEKAVAALEAHASRLGFTPRKTSAGVLQALLPDTTSFSSVDAWYQASKDVATTLDVKIEVMLASKKADLLLVARFGKKRGREDDEPPSQDVLDEVQDKVDSMIKKVEKSAQNTIVKQEIEAAKTVFQKSMLLRSDGGPVVQSMGLFQKKLTAADPRPRLVLALRLHAGIVVPVSVLKGCMGGCWADGALTVLDTVNGVDSVQLPLTQEGKASKDFGNLPILVVTSVNPAK